MTFAKPLKYLVALALAGAALTSGCGLEVFDRPATATPTFEPDPSWPSLPDDFVFGQVVGVAVDAVDRVYVFHRANAQFDNTELIEQPTIAVIDAETGELLDEFGDALFVVPHGLAIDAEGNLWATDVGADAVLKLSPTGDVLDHFDGAER